VCVWAYVHKDAVCMLRGNIVVICVPQSTIQVVLKRKNDSFNANTMEILARGASPLPLLHSTIRTIKHHLHCFAPNLAMQWSVVCPCCLLSSCKQCCMFLMKFERVNRATNEVKQRSAGADLSSRCETCASTALRLVHCNMYRHRGKFNHTLSASQLLRGMLVAQNTNKPGTRTHTIISAPCS